MKWANLLILAAALTAIVCVALVAGARATNATLVYGFAGISATQILHMIKGTLGDREVEKKMEQELREGLNIRIDSRILPVVEAVVDKALDVRLVPAITEAIAPVVTRVDLLDERLTRTHPVELVAVPPIVPPP